MANENSLADANNNRSLIGLTTGGETRNVRTTDDGALLVSGSTGGTTIGSVTIAPSTAAAISTVAVTTTSGTALAANANRKGAMVVNESTSPGIALIAMATAASSTAYSAPVAPGGYWEMPLPAYTGAISVVTVSTAATLRVTELT